MKQFAFPLLWRVLPACLLMSVFMFGGCSYTIKIKDGRTAYERKQFATAVPMLENEFLRAKTRSEKGQLAFMLGDSYRRRGADAKAADWFKTAYDNNYGPEALKAYAFELKKLQRYPEAREAFKNLGIEIGSPYEYRKEITATNISEGWLKEAKDGSRQIEAVPFNSAQNDFAPALFSNGQLVFTSDRSAAVGEELYRWTNHAFMDLFVVDPAGASAQIFDGRLNTPANEGTAVFNSKFTEIFFVRSVGAYKGDDAYNKLFVSEYQDGAWTEPTPLPFLKEKINYLHPTLSADGNTLFFACNDPEGWGGYDLWSVQRNPRAENGWDTPKVLSRNINTPGNELFPGMEADTLYFASDGLPGMGGLDLFRTYRVERTNWAPPLNLKAPLNSGADDFGLLIVSTTKKKSGFVPGEVIRSGYFSSNRPNGKGGDDIYRFDERVPQLKPPVKDTLPAKPLVYKMVLEGYVLEKIRSNPDDPNSNVLGRKPLPGAAVRIEINGKKQSITVNDDGFFTLELAENTDYNFIASKTDYLSNSTRFSTRGIARDPANPVQVFEIEIVLDKIFRNREIVLENIYYDYDKWDIRPDAEPTLNRLAEVLRQNTGIRIELGSHTDCRGNDRYNLDLSQRRAQSAVNYLIDKGIDAARLSALGYGEGQPANTCVCTRCTETEHQENRRTTFKVLE